MINPFSNYITELYSSPETNFDSCPITSAIFLVSSRSLSLRFLINVYAFLILTR